MTLKEVAQSNPNAILVNSGVLFDVFNPEPELIQIEDIGHALSHLCRYGGHTPKFYSVAQHSVYCSYHPGTLKEQMQYLLHDASEAYMVDLPRPIKRNLPEYRKTEDNLLEVILGFFEVNFPLSDSTHDVDNLILGYEYYNLFEIKNKKFDYWNPSKAKQIFVKRYYELAIALAGGSDYNMIQPSDIQVKFLQDFTAWSNIRNLAGLV
jgi:hypothetical protein